MTHTVRFEDGALADAASAAVWYENQAPGTGARLIDAVTAMRATLTDWPRTGQLVNDPSGREVRRLRVEGFPHHLIYVVADDEVLVVAVAHDRRRPGYWSERI